METIIRDELKGTLSSQRVVTSAKTVIFSPQSVDWLVCLCVGSLRNYWFQLNLVGGRRMVN